MDGAGKHGCSSTLRMRVACVKEGDETEQRVVSGDEIVVGKGRK